MSDTTLDQSPAADPRRKPDPPAPSPSGRGAANCSSAPSCCSWPSS
ncbi:hypothetical protein KGD82_06140 [Nocardiopsis eucommiae]|uniref:Uncharacterized protein n=1 Tax=Nocardiopsis eucommiae TaxID=2831970 RepID=A0A975LAP6_9ACTN|nr:hypothetical protein KGD82_06140 [Nocardiopsis eucommiae]